MKKKVIAIMLLVILISAVSAFLYLYISKKNFRVGAYGYSFDNHDEWYDLDFSLSVNKYYGEEKDIKIPSHFLFWKITHIGMFLFKNNTDIENAYIPDTVIEIESEAFINCSNLKSVRFSDSLDYIALRAFYNCTSLSEIELPESLDCIGYNVFNGCTSLESIYIPEKVRFIGDGAFYYCSNLKSVTGGAGLEVIEENAFEKTPWLDEYEGDFVQINNILIKYKGQEKEVVIPENIVSTSSDAFYDSEVEEIYMNDIRDFNLWISSEFVKINGKVKIHFGNSDEFKVTAWDPQERFIFCCPSDSLAIQYAKENGIEYIIEE